MLVSRFEMTWGVSFLPRKAEPLGDTLFLFIPAFNRKSYRRSYCRSRGARAAPGKKEAQKEVHPGGEPHLLARSGDRK
jgi:hypothetical protein